MLEKRKVKHEDWNLFQMCLTLMQTIGTVIADFILSNLLIYNDIKNSIETTTSG